MEKKDIFESIRDVKKSLQKNIQGFITKDLEVGEIEKAILAVENGNLFYCNDAQKILYEMNNFVYI